MSTIEREWREVSPSVGFPDKPALWVDSAFMFGCGPSVNVVSGIHRVPFNMTTGRSPWCAGFNEQKGLCILNSQWFDAEGKARMLKKSRHYPIDCYEVTVDVTDWSVRQCRQCRCCMTKQFFSKKGWRSDAVEGVDCINCDMPSAPANDAWIWDKCTDGPRTASEVEAFNQAWPDLRARAMLNAERKAQVEEFERKQKGVKGVFDGNDEENEEGTVAVESSHPPWLPRPPAAPTIVPIPAPRVPGAHMGRGIHWILYC